VAGPNREVAINQHSNLHDDQLVGLV